MSAFPAHPNPSLAELASYRAEFAVPGDRHPVETLSFSVLQNPLGFGVEDDSRSAAPFAGCLWMFPAFPAHSVGVCADCLLSFFLFCFFFDCLLPFVLAGHT